MAVSRKAHRRPRRKSREPYGAHIDKPRPPRAKAIVHEFNTLTARWVLTYDRRGKLLDIDRYE
jgi:hypothetical protein